MALKVSLHQNVHKIIQFFNDCVGFLNTSLGKVKMLASDEKGFVLFF